MTNESTTENIAKFLQFYNKQLATLSEREFELNQQHTHIEEKVAKINKLIKKQKPETTSQIQRTLNILVQQAGSDRQETIFHVTYLVKRASWKASYDVRVSTTSNDISITYYGLINQSSGEAWRNTKICLSTANPSLRSDPPVLHGLNLGYKPKPSNVSYKKDKKRELRRSNSLEEEKEKKKECENIEIAKIPSSSLKSAPLPPNFSPPPAPPAPVMESVVAEAQQGATSATYTIPRQATIPSDGHYHKVTIAVVKLTNCIFTHFAVPKLDTNAYLKVKAKNDSPYSFLEGPMNVFFDNNFVATSSLVAISPGEEFETFLSRDPGVKITYVPPTKYRESKGIFGRTNTSKVQRKVIVKNNKTLPVSLVVKDQLPRASSEVIKVTLSDPIFPHDKKELLNYSIVQPIRKDDKKRVANLLAKSVKLDDQNLMEWDIPVIESQHEVEIPFVYVIEWPGQFDLNEM
jgi:uncharacterized protein (TIGR02231 family)